MNLDQIPILTTVFNNHEELKKFIGQCEDYKLKNIIVINSASTKPETIKFLNNLKYQVIHLEENLGPRYPIYSQKIAKLLPDQFIISDPDITFNPLLPKNFLKILLEVALNYKSPKVGFALDIYNPEINNSLTITPESKQVNLIDWEQQFWQKEVGITSDHNPIYEALIDTTFHLFTRKYFDPNNELKALRIAGHYTCIHTPWLKTNSMATTSNSLYSSTNPNTAISQNLYISYLKIQIENLNYEIQELNTELQNTYNSKSWHLTKPLRKLTKIFRQSK